jgi:dTDP-4-dehydrorhamnose reductase
MRVAVTGATGRLGSALVTALADAPFTGPSGPVGWTRLDLDLEDPAATIDAILDRERPEVVVHAAAWTDVDGCTRDPELANRRNGTATGIIATACGRRDVDLLVVSTNEVFAGDRDDGLGYGPDDPLAPANPYGASKALGERAAREAFAATATRAALGIARTAWLYGPPGRDFPWKILEAARAAEAARTTLRAVADEWGSPTYAADVADAIVELLAEDAHRGTHHLVNAGTATRADWARDVVTRFGIPVTVEEVPGTTWERASTPPRWGVLAPTPLPSDEPLRPWPQAMADYAPSLERRWRAAR